MSTKIIALSLPSELVELIDEAAKADYTTRTDFIKQTVLLRLRGQHIAVDDNPTPPRGLFELAS